MVAVLAILMIVVPLAELAVIIKVGSTIGVVPTLAILVILSAGGAWLMKREGLGVWRRARAQVDAGRVPGRELVDGVLILMGGALMLTPGFITDAVGLLLLVPPVRAGLRRFGTRRIERRVRGRRVYFER